MLYESIYELYIVCSTEWSVSNPKYELKGFALFSFMSWISLQYDEELIFQLLKSTLGGISMTWGLWLGLYLQKEESTTIYLTQYICCIHRCSCILEKKNDHKINTLIIPSS